MKSYRWLLIISLSFFILSCAKGGTYSIFLRYQPMKEITSLMSLKLFGFSPLLIYPFNSLPSSNSLKNFFDKLNYFVYKYFAFKLFNKWNRDV